MPDQQAGYMTATEFHIASALQPLHAGGVHIWLAERGEFELSGDFVKPFSKPLLLLVADEKLTGGQPLQRESQAQVIEHQALEFAGQ